MAVMFRVFSAVITIFMVMPIWFYLLYKILVAINASDLMWFLYIAYLPAVLIAMCISAILRESENDRQS